MGPESDLQFGYVNCTLVIFSPILSPVNLLLHSLSLSIFPNSSPTNRISFCSSISSSILLSHSKSPACSRLCTISPYFSLVNILSCLSSIIFITKERLHVSCSLFTCTPHCGTSVSDEVTICLPISGELLIRECRLGLCFLSTSAHQKGTK